MNYKLIMLPNPIVVSDEEIKEGDCGILYSKGIKGVGSDWNQFKHDGSNKSKLFSIARDSYKIVAGIPELPSIDFSGLSDDDCKKIGWIDVENLGGRWATLQTTRSTDYWRAISNAYSQGFKSAQSLNEKKYSLEDIKTAIELARFPKLALYNTDEIVNMLSQPKIFDVEIQVNQNSIKITKIL